MPTVLSVLLRLMKLSFTVNNAVWARVCFVALLLLFYPAFSYGQNISKYYTSHHQENGIIYFIEEQEGFRNESSSLKYDITYLTNSDSATLNFSFTTTDEVKIDSLILQNNQIRLASATSRLYVEFRKNKWVYRYSSRFLYKDLENFYVDGIPNIDLKSGKDTFRLEIKQNKWKEQHSIIKNIMTLINLNK